MVTCPETTIDSQHPRRYVNSFCMCMLNINKWITFIQQNQFFEIMEDIKRNDEADKPKSNTPQRQVRKPVTGSSSPARSTTDPVASQPTAAPKVTATSVTASKTAAGPAKIPVETTRSKSAAKPSARPADTVIQKPEKAPGVSTPVAEKKSKKLVKAFKKLKIQKKEIASLEKNRDRLMKDLISAIENKKKSKRIRNLARDFNRIEKRVKNRTASYMQAKKKLTNKMK
jgi:hypothetical protein